MSRPIPPSYKTKNWPACRDGRMHLRFARGHEYFVGFPVVATCRGCGTLNQAQSPAR
ncbi:hypothetical protein [Antarctobacter heliothermus]|uniref:hypothetical protein n=1 Tax=Antarctobacter heliothermus TaxID=74033 RepID=UPI00148398F0|nr:hypothetical protein [Antarctobacter heliothermus]